MAGLDVLVLDKSQNIGSDYGIQPPLCKNRQIGGNGSGTRQSGDRGVRMRAIQSTDPPLLDLDQCRSPPMIHFLLMGGNPVTGVLTLVCMQTGREIDTRTPYTQDDLAKAEWVKLLLHCRFCRKTHLFNFSDARVKPIGTGNGSPASTH